MIVQWDQLIAQSVFTAIPIVGSLLLYWWKRGDTAKKEQEERHEENKQALSKTNDLVASLINEGQFLPQHFHQEHYTEKNGDAPLQVNGIIMQPVKRKV